MRWCPSQRVVPARAPGARCRRGAQPRDSRVLRVSSMDCPGRTRRPDRHQGHSSSRRHQRAERHRHPTSAPGRPQRTRGYASSPSCRAGPRRLQQRPDLPCCPRHRSPSHADRPGSGRPAQAGAQLHDTSTGAPNGAVTMPVIHGSDRRRCGSLAVCHRGSMRSSGYGHMADSVRGERAVRITARFADPRPFCPRYPGAGLLV
jgi:hypothetical protein